MKIDLNAIVDPYDARVVVRPAASDGAAGQTGPHPHAGPQARFDLAGLPRVEGLIQGKSWRQALSLTEHLCGICPAAHHLAGVRALDQLVDKPVSDEALLVRRLLHYGSHLEQHALRFAPLERDGAVTLRRFGKLAMAAAGAPGHFPQVAVPGGVAQEIAPAALAQLQEQLAAALHAAERMCELALAVEAGQPNIGGGDGAASAAASGLESAEPKFTGVNVALADSAGQPDLLGSHVKAVNAAGELVAFLPASEWPKLVAEALPGEIAPQPYLTVLGAQAGWYRVGPTAQLSIGELTTQKAAQYQQRWLAGARRALSARAVVSLHCVEQIARICEKLATREVGASPIAATNAALPIHAGTATGLVDSPRGILEHSYSIDASGHVTQARILTPTAQNEPWLAQLLTAAIAQADAAEREAALEDSIREADPCLPISAAPAGTMSLNIDILKSSDMQPRELH